MMELVPDPDAEEPLASPVRNHGVIDPRKLSPISRHTLLQLGGVLRAEPGLRGIQITFNNLVSADEPPTIHVITDPDLAPDWPSYWFGPSSMGRPE